MILQNTPAEPPSGTKTGSSRPSSCRTPTCKDVMTVLRSLLATRFIAANERLNAIVMLDSVEKVKVAERHHPAGRQGQGRSRHRRRTAGDQHIANSRTSGISLDANTPRHPARHRRRGRAAQDVGRRIAESEQLGADRARLPVRLREEGRPTRRRWRSRRSGSPKAKRASFSIGDRVPIPVTSFNTANTAGSNVVPITSYQYQNVGIQVDITPRVHHNEEISLDLEHRGQRPERPDRRASRSSAAATSRPASACATARPTSSPA